MRPLAYWAPPVVWMAIILGFSSSSFSAEHTGWVLEPVVTWFWPSATAAQLAFVHALVRKAAHVVEYAILGALWFRTLVHTRPGRAGPAAWLAFALAAAWAIIDESHQASVPTRTASTLDVGLDAAGAGAAVLAMRLGWALGGDLATTALLWFAAVGGVAVIGVNLLAGIDSGSLWVTVPLAALLLALQSWRRARRRARSPRPARDPGSLPEKPNRPATP